ncbi:hypothetical protein OIU77_004734 [Salix suchowensis]|uniref:Uncharacterized protein n=1 Tax=Salix suchowensis TaxID=1278906 RepID=A0ABQ9AXN9_9ROSI|nr:hypothetical protein OIU77_004734 [Salix suchowensis]
MSSSNIIMFEDIFVVDKLDPDGKKFDKVTRIEAHSQNCDMFMHLDVNTDVYPMFVNDKFTMAFGPYAESGWDTGHRLLYSGNLGGRKTLADKYEYVMHGKLYQIQEEGSRRATRTEMVITFGGLLMLLKGDPSYVSQFELDQRLFCLIRKL